MFYNYWQHMEKGAWDRPTLSARPSAQNPRLQYAVFAPTDTAFQVGVGGGGSEIMGSGFRV
jgi:hypothetical protein